MCVDRLVAVEIDRIMAPPVRKLPAGHEIAIGAHRGHLVTKHKVEKPFRTRPSRMPSHNKHARFVRDLIREVSGLQPYEKRVIELLKIGKDKRALKFIKRRVSLLFVCCCCCFVLKT